jgi:hypothetical protein
LSVGAVRESEYKKVLSMARVKINS